MSYLSARLVAVFGLLAHEILPSNQCRTFLCTQ
jgi:hypothetical protein